MKDVSGSFKGDNGDFIIYLKESAYHKDKFVITYNTKSGFWGGSKEYKKDLTLNEALQAYAELESIIRA